MSGREVKALTKDPGHVVLKERLRRDQTVGTMETEDTQEEIQDLKSQLATSKEEAESQYLTILQLKAEAEETTRTHQEQLDATTHVKELAEERVNRLEKQLEESSMRSELELLRALENLRAENCEAIRREQREVDRERQQAQERIQALTDSFQLEKTDLLRQLERLNFELKTLQAKMKSKELDIEADGDPTDPTATEDGVVGEAVLHVEDGTEDVALTGVEVTTPAVPPGSTRAATPIVLPGSTPSRVTTTAVSGSSVTTPGSTCVSTPVVSPRVSTSVSLSETELTGGSTSPGVTAVATTREPRGAIPASTPTSATPVVPPGPVLAVGESLLVDTMTRFLKAHTEAIAAQTQATAAQHLPPLKAYTGEGKQVEEDGFERWIEQFEERAKIASWSTEQQLHQLKLLLENTALRVYRALPPADQNNYTKIVSSLRARFKAVDIEELRGIEFHHRVQKDETIESLGLELQALGRKAFPSIQGREFDRLLKGRFFQALHVKWQRKIGAPKPSETFQELYDRARVLERHEQQYVESAASRGDVLRKSTSRGREGNQKGSVPPKTVPRREEKEVPRISQEPVCFHCKQLGHYKSDCPQRGRQPEAPGRSNRPKSSQTSRPSSGGSQGTGPSRNAPLETKPVETQLNSLTIEQLEVMLAEKRLSQESNRLPEDRATMSTVTVSKEECPKAVGPTVYVQVEVSGVSVEAMLDTGAQSTIISRELLHKVVRHLQATSKPVPKLRIPSAKLYGKDGTEGGREIVITAELDLEISVDGESISVPVFVQPGSSQPCLLGMNAIPALGFSLLSPKGQILIVRNDSKPKVSVVRLVQGVTVPSLKGSFVKVKADGVSVLPGDSLLFEPVNDHLESKGLYSHESLVTIDRDGCMLVPMVNVHGAATRLIEGMEIGYAQPLDVAKTVTPKSQCALVETKAITQTSERLSELKRVLGVDHVTLSEEQRVQLTELITNYSDVFALANSELGCTDIVCHSIDTGDSRPIKQRPYRTPIIHRETISRMIDEMEEQGVVQPSISPWASPVVLVPKKDGSQRFCVDYRRLNALTKRDVYRLPRIDDILDTAGGAKYFSTLDLASGYWQVELDQSAREKSAFTTHRGLFEFTRMPFGLCNAPATFQRLMQVILTGLEGKSCFVYLDDILVVSSTFEDHLSHLAELFERLRRAGLRLKPKKCLLLRKEVPYLGHVMTTSGIRPDPAKIETVKNFLTPTDVTKIRQFLGLASYYRRFIPAFARIAHPLHRLTKKDVPFHWNSDCETAFERLKECLMTAPILSYPQCGPDKRFILETDASGLGLGAILSQEQEGQVHPIAYASRTLDPHECNYGISELETLALVWAVRHFRPYILGHHTVAYTDHSACTSLLNNPRPTGKLARWALTIQELDLEIKHRSGKSNSNADALSRNPVAQVNSVETLTFVDGEEEAIPRPEVEQMAQVQAAQREDPELRVLCQYLESDVLPTDEKEARRTVIESDRYELIHGVLHYEPPAFIGRLCVVVPKSRRADLLHEAHANCFAGHFSAKKVYDRLRRHYWWKGMRADVYHFCRKCLVCASRKGPGRPVRSPLVPIPVGGPFHRVGVDVLQLPVTHRGNRYVVCFVDYLTKWAEAFPMADQRADTIARIFVEQIVCRHGVPEQLLSDRGTNFLSELIKGVCDILGIKKINTSGYHPQTDGLVEKFNSTLVNMIAKCCETKKRDWDDHLPYLLYAYRTMVQESTHESPFYLLYGRDSRLPTETGLSMPSPTYEVDMEDYRSELVTKLSHAWCLAKNKIEKAQDAQKIQYDKRARVTEIQVGDRVMVYMPSSVKGKDRKLARPYHGPYRVLKVTPSNVEVTLVDKPQDPSIFISLNRVRRCYDEMEDHSWTGSKRKSRKRNVRQPSPVFPPEDVSHSEAESPLHSVSDVEEDTSPEPPEPSPKQESISRNTRAKTRARKKT